MSAWLIEHKDKFYFLSTRDEKILAVYGQIIQYLADSPLYQELAVRNWSSYQVADLWLIAAAKVFGDKIVTFEQGHLPNRNDPSRNPQIPVVGNHFGVECETLFSYLHRMKMKL